MLELKDNEKEKLLEGLIEKTKSDKILWEDGDGNYFTTTINNIPISVTYWYNRAEEKLGNAVVNLPILYDCDVLIEHIEANIDRQTYRDVLYVLEGLC